jgi:hypothetical protein
MADDGRQYSVPQQVATLRMPSAPPRASATPALSHAARVYSELASRRRSPGLQGAACAASRSLAASLQSCSWRQRPSCSIPSGDIMGQSIRPFLGDRGRLQVRAQLFAELVQRMWPQAVAAWDVGDKMNPDQARRAQLDQVMVNGWL